MLIYSAFIFHVVHCVLSVRGLSQFLQFSHPIFSVCADSASWSEDFVLDLEPG